MSEAAVAPNAALKKVVDDALPDWAKLLTRVFDDSVGVPGTGLRFGLDGVIGLFLPTAGDALTGVGSIALLSLALSEHVPRFVLFKMVGNICVDVVFGMFPGIGDAFDLVWKSNKRNMVLIETHRHTGRPPGWFDYGLVLFGMGMAVASVLVPILVVIWLGTKLGDLGIQSLQAFGQWIASLGG